MPPLGKFGNEADFWSGRKVLVTGHTGFKGAWLTLWLTHLGAKVVGFSLPPVTSPNLFTQTKLEDLLTNQFIADVRDLDSITRTLDSVCPDIVFHLASQTIVRESYRSPVDTFLINIQGTVNLLEGIRRHNLAIPTVVVTSDKCYRNKEIGESFIESDALGGGDPYSASKACQDIVAESMCQSLFSGEGRIATARAGNAIGGGDWATDRLVPDIVRSVFKGGRIELRYPNAVRPWQYVLEPISGYLALAERLSTEPSISFSAFNFGPPRESAIPVHSFVTQFGAALGHRLQVDTCKVPEKEAGLLRINSNKAYQKLNWKPRIDLTESISETVRWYKRVSTGESPRKLSLEAISRFEDM